MKSFKKSSTRLTASLAAVVAQFHQLPNNARVQNIVQRVSRMGEAEVKATLEGVVGEFSHRHKYFDDLLLNHFMRTEKIAGALPDYSPDRKRLLGAYLTKEYSIQAAALFNPSIVPHPDQSGVKDGEQRFVMSLRATGEGHISSIIFKTGTVNRAGDVSLDKTSGRFSVLKKSAVQPQRSAMATESDEDYLDTNYDLESPGDLELTEKVIFPSAACESMGMEDIRLVKFEDGEESVYYGTYTAYNGKNIRTMLLETRDFNSFKIRTLRGEAINDKGMALFPEKINGRYVICSRQGSEKLSIMYSHDLYQWDEYSLLKEPEFDWEFVQIGNCGSPIKTEKGWLLLTHGVGAFRKYVISAILLDLENPSKIIGQLTRPLLSAAEEEREGYVPNVVYTCGFLRHDKIVLIPYAISDTATVFASFDLEEILDEMAAGSFSTPKPLNDSTTQPLNDSTPQPLNNSTPQPLNP